MRKTILSKVVPQVTRHDMACSQYAIFTHRCIKCHSKNCYCVLNNILSTCAAMSGKQLTSDSNVTGSRPPTVTTHSIRYVLLVNSPNKFNL